MSCVSTGMPDPHDQDSPYQRRPDSQPALPSPYSNPVPPPRRESPPDEPAETPPDPPPPARFEMRPRLPTLVGYTQTAQPGEIPEGQAGFEGRPMLATGAVPERGRSTFAAPVAGTSRGRRRPLLLLAVMALVAIGLWTVLTRLTFSQVSAGGAVAFDDLDWLALVVAAVAVVMVRRLGQTGDPIVAASAMLATAVAVVGSALAIAIAAGLVAGDGLGAAMHDMLSMGLTSVLFHSSARVVAVDCVALVIAMGGSLLPQHRPT